MKEVIRLGYHILHDHCSLRGGNGVAEHVKRELLVKLNQQQHRIPSKPCCYGVLVLVNVSGFPSKSVGKSQQKSRKSRA